jgi:PKD repeat protein
MFLIGLAISQTTNAQVLPCQVNMFFEQSTSNSNIYTFNATLTGDSVCGMYNPQYTWTIYGNPSITLTGSQVTYTFPQTGTYYVCVNAAYQGLTSTTCDTVMVYPPQNCTPNFTASSQGLSAFFTTVVPPSCFDSTTVYNWSFGDGNNATVTGITNISHVYSASATYQVCLTATTANGQTSNPCNSVTVSSGQGPFNLGGMVLSNGACTQDTVMVELYGLNNNHYSSTYLAGLQDSCFYYLQTALIAMPSQYIIRATPMNNPAYIPTYFGDVLFWGDATVINPMENLWNLNINLLQNIYDTIPALGTVSGTITGNGVSVSSTFNGNPINTTFIVTASRVIVLNSLGQPVGFAIANPDGSFSIGNLPAGNYSLRVDNPKVPSTSIPFTISGGNTTTVNFAATASGIAAVTSTGNKINAQSVQIVPNPAGNQISVAGISGDFEILDAQGRSVLRSTSAQKIDISNLSSGIFQIRGLSKEGKSVSARFIKK